MKNAWTCSQGHQWESIDEHDLPSDCPSCGGPATTMHSGAGIATNVQRDELPPLPRSRPGMEMVLQPRITSQNYLPEVAGFELIEEIGRGGMGVVYHARQLLLNRPVALKMLLSGEYAGEDERHRFQREGQSVARLRHPNIVQVYLVGEQGGRPYLCMEFIAGPSLAVIAAGHPLAVSIAAKMVQDLSGAVHAAHQHGVIHRDLKPANVLLEGSGKLTPESRNDERVWSLVTPKITDFGLAKRVDDARLTHSGAVIGTPSYMAPEQAEGRIAEIGPSTDIYALGAILYELLTGRPPYLGSNASDTIRQIATDDPVPPRLLQPRIPRDLETICRRALERDPRRRYLSAQALSDDLRRFREGLPVVARPVTLMERFWKWSRRRPAAAGLLAVSSVASLALLITWAYFTFALKVQRDEADAARGKEREQRTIADTNFQQAREAVDTFLIQISQDQLLHQPGLQPLRRELLASAQEYYELFLKQHGQDHDLRMEAALTHGRMGLIQRELGDLSQAQTACTKALAIYEQMWATQHDSSVAIRLASTYHDLALIHRMSGRLPEARDLYRRALDLNEQLVAEMPQDLERRRGMAKTLSNMGVLAAATGADRDAIDFGNRACEILAKIAAQSSLADDRLNWARGLINYAPAQAADASGEMATLERASQLLQDLAELHPSQQEIRIQQAKCLHNLGIARSQSGAKLKGCETIAKAIEINRRLVHDNPQVQEMRQQLATSLYVLAVLELRDGKIPEAIQHTTESQQELDFLLEQSPEDPAFLSLSGVILHQSGQILVSAGNTEQAIEKYKLAIGRQELALKFAPSSTTYQQLLESHRTALEGK